MMVDALLQHEVEEREDMLEEEAGGLENKRAELADKLAIKVDKQLQGLLPTIVAQVGDHISNQWINGIRINNATDNNIQEDDRNANLGNDRNSGCGDNQKVKYSDSSLTVRALTWWNSEVKTRGQAAAVGMTCENFKALMKEEYYTSNEMQRLEAEF
ncbi:hypothetical protein Tco_0472747 [Tanacetum coccineum]